jgi:HD-GYP domain-containing protein (c-di-GMP phosphodiesterase class II)
MQHLKRIKVFCDDLQPGMFVSELDRDWNETSFLLQGFSIEGPSDVEEIKRHCKFVYVDFRSEQQFQRYKLDTSSSPSYRQHLQSTGVATSSDIRKKLKPALKARKKTSKIMMNLLDKVALGEDFDLHAVRTSVKENVKHVLENQEAMLMMTMLQEQNESVAQHSYNVSILAIAFAQALNFSEAELEDIGMAALLHDIGQLKINQQLLQKKGRLNQNERDEVAKHCHNAYQLLADKEELTPSCIDVAMSHHERLNGQGYPRGLSKDKIVKNVRIISILDVFEALTSHQSYRKAKSIMDAYKVLMAGKNTHFDEKLVLAFIKWRTIYPPGSIVEMQNGEVGIVVSSNQQHKLKPRVLLVLNEYKQPRKERMVDLSSLELDPESKPYKIIKAYENLAFGIDLQEYAEKGLKIQL